MTTITVALRAYLKWSSLTTLLLALFSVIGFVVTVDEVISVFFPDKKISDFIPRIYLVFATIIIATLDVFYKEFKKMLCML